MKFVHGTSSMHLESINEHGLLPPDNTGYSSEKRDERLNHVHVLDAQHTKLAGAYALRAVRHWGGKPIIVSGELPEAAVSVTLSGKGKFPDIYTVPYVPLLHIDSIELVDETADISEMFKSHKS
jgi:hypothetical protein